MGPQKCQSGEEHPSSAFASSLADSLRGLRLPAAALAMSLMALAGMILIPRGICTAIRNPQLQWPLLSFVFLAPAGLRPFGIILSEVRSISSRNVMHHMHHFLPQISSGQNCVLSAGIKEDWGLG